MEGLMGYRHSNTPQRSMSRSKTKTSVAKIKLLHNYLHMKKNKEEEVEQISYKDAVSELENILESLDNEEIDVDFLSEKVKRAGFLIKYCKAKLQDTQDEVQKALETLKK